MPADESILAKAGSLLALYGGWGLFVASYLDSSFLSLPLVNDLLLIHLSSQSPSRALVYALQATAGSVFGASTVYALSRGGGNLIWRDRPARLMKPIQHWLERNDFVAVLVATLLPPPMPFKLFAISAGVLHVNFARFAMALLAGRSLRFVASAMLAARYGARAEATVRANIGWSSVVVVTMLLGITVVSRRFWRALREAPPEAPEPVESPDSPESSSPDVS